MAFKRGKLTIATGVDGGVESLSTYDADMEITPFSAFLRYTDNGAFVRLRLENDEVSIEREGDYTLSLRLKEGERFSGKLGVSGSFGELETQTKMLNYSIKTVKNTSFLLALKYDLLFSNGEKQEMKIRLFAKTEKNSEEK